MEHHEYMRVMDWLSAVKGRQLPPRLIDAWWVEFGDAPAHVFEACVRKVTQNSTRSGIEYGPVFQALYDAGWTPKKNREPAADRTFDAWFEFVCRLLNVDLDLKANWERDGWIDPDGYVNVDLAALFYQDWIADSPHRDREGLGPQGIPNATDRKFYVANNRLRFHDGTRVYVKAPAGFYDGIRALARKALGEPSHREPSTDIPF